MEIIIKGTPKEIADLVVSVQNRLNLSAEEIAFIIASNELAEKREFLNLTQIDDTQSFNRQRNQG